MTADAAQAAPSSAPSAAPPAPRLYRRTRQRILGGVAGGLADHLGVPTAAIRVVFVLLAIGGGIGVVLYAVYWIVVPTRPDAPPSRVPQWLEYTAAALIAIGSIIGVTEASSSLGRLFIPAMLACLGAALIWRQATDSQRARWSVWSRTPFGGDRIGRIRLVCGVGLVVVGAVIILATSNFYALRDGFIAVVVTLVGVGLITGPWWARMVGDLNAERYERIRSQERADLAARLHDSVLQTLALIQRNADSPREVTRLARGQERELRTLLYGEPGPTGQLADALQAAAGEVEDAYAIKVDIVVVGDAPLDDRLGALVAASREAMVNAAKHAGVTTVSLYAEVEADGYVAYVKDRGVGFDLATVAADRQGVRGSIIGRVERHGGTVRLRTGPGSGTEVEIRIAR